MGVNDKHRSAHDKVDTACACGCWQCPKAPPQSPAWSCVFCCCACAAASSGRVLGEFSRDVIDCREWLDDARSAVSGVPAAAAAAAVVVAAGAAAGEAAGEAGAAA
eukprot:Rhum_TRINITY_DN15245_c15_g1::Rhum_TRINITY_DN15245_c15_g1_i1::g.146998::m.146998